MANKATKRRANGKATGRKHLAVKYFTRRHLIECARLGREWDYNRQVSERVEELPEANYPVVVQMTHHHRHGERCEPHMRCGVAGPNGLIAFIDVPMWYYEKLPERRVPARLLAA